MTLNGQPVDHVDPEHIGHTFTIHGLAGENKPLLVSVPLPAVPDDKVPDTGYTKDPNVPVDVNIEVVYGDSVTGDTPLLLRKNGLIHIETIQSIFNENCKQEYPGFKIFDTTIRLEKEYSLSDYQIWSDVGWVDIKKVIRHKTKTSISFSFIVSLHYTSFKLKKTSLYS